MQLSPTVQSAEAERKGLGRTLFERLAALYGDKVTSMLTVQYRMHRLIMQWSSHELYNDKVLEFSAVRCLKFSWYLESHLMSGYYMVTVD